MLLRLPSEFRADFQIGTYLSSCSLSRSSKHCQAPDVWSGKLFGDLNLFYADLLLIGFLLPFFFFIFQTFLPLSSRSSSAEKPFCKSRSECLQGGGKQQGKTFSAVAPLISRGSCTLRTEELVQVFCLLTHVLSRKEEAVREWLVSEPWLLSLGFHNLEPIAFSCFFTNFLMC